MTVSLTADFLSQNFHHLVSRKGERIERVNLVDLEHSVTMESIQGGPRLFNIAANLTGQQKEDVLNSTLMAQLETDKKFGQMETDNIATRYQFFLQAMENLGWVLQHQVEKEYHAPSPNTFELFQVTLDMLSNLVEEEAGIMEAVKGAYNSLANSSSRSFFLSQPCSLDKSQQVTTKFIFCSFMWSSQDIKFSYAITKCTFDEKAYAQVREDVKKKLQNEAKKHISELDLGPPGADA